MLHDDALADRLADGFETAGLDERRLEMCRYADKLTQAPSSIARDDVERLRSVGFEDPDILAIVEVTAYYAYANRIVDGLGVELE